MDTFTRTRIPAQHPGLTCSRKRTLFASTVLAAVITVTAKYLSFVGSTMVDKAGRPCLSRAPAGHGPRPLCLIFPRGPPLAEISYTTAEISTEILKSPLKS